MKYFKKILSVIIAISIVMTTCVGFSSCSKGSVELSVGDYLVTLVDEFGMYLGTDELTNDIALETAKDWEIIENEQLNVRENVTKGFVLVTLVKTVGFYDTKNMSDVEIAEYASKNEYSAFAYKGEKDFNKKAGKDETLKSIEKAKYIWQNPNFEEKMDIKYADNVADLSAYSFNEEETSGLNVPNNNGNGIVSNENGDLSEEIDVISDSKRKTVVLDGKVDLEKGQTYVSPTVGPNAANEIYTVDDIEYKDGKTYIKNSDEEIDIEEVIETAEFSGSEIDDLTTVPIIDGNGIVHYPDNTNTTTNVSNELNTPEISNMAYTPNKVEPNYLGGANGADVINTSKNNFTVDFGPLKATISMSKNSFKCKLTGTIEPGKIKDKFNNPNIKAKIKIDGSVEIKDISSDYNVSMTKRSAYVAVNTTEVDSIGATVQVEGRKEFPIKDTKIDDLPEKSSAVISKTLAKIPIHTTGVTSICLLVKAKIAVDGSVEFIVTTDSTTGLEVKKGNLRFINDVNRDKDVNIKAKLEGTVYVGPAIYIAKVNVVSAGFEGGLGTEYKCTIHVYDKNTKEQLFYQEVGTDIQEYGNIQENVDKGVDLCHDVKAYFIFKAGIDTEAWLFKKLKMSYSHEFLGKENACFLDKHFEDGKEVDKCSRKYERETTTSTTEEGNYSKNIETQELNSTIYEGKTTTIKISALPEGYTKGDLKFVSNDTEVAMVDDKGNVTGKISGSTTITISTNDGKYSMEYAVFVVEKLNYSNENNTVFEGAYSI